MRFGVRKADLFASLVVSLVALPLCVGVAIASGAAELGLVTGVVGGLVAGVLPGSGLQVSGPAAGLAVLVFAAGVVQLGLGALRLGRWFRAVPVVVVQGMLAGIGIVLVAGQVYALGDASAPGGALGTVGGLVSLPGDANPVALGVGGATLAVLLLWRRRWAWGGRLVPGPLVAVVLASGATWVFDLDVRRVEVRGLLAAVRVPEVAVSGGSWSGGARDGRRLRLDRVRGVVVRCGCRRPLRRGVRTDHDRDLMAQGVGNAVCGVLGALPMTAVIVRGGAAGTSLGGVRAGARTKVSLVLYGVWLLVFVAMAPGALGGGAGGCSGRAAGACGVRARAGAGGGGLWRGHRGEVVVLVVTAGAIVVAGLFEGVVVGLALAVGKTAWDVSRVRVEIGEGVDGCVVVRVVGHATFLRLPKLLDDLEAVETVGGLKALSPGREVRLELGGLRHVDHACAAALEGWAAARGRV